MPAVYEGAVQDLIDEFGELPGIGPKSAQRMAFHVLAADAAAVERLIEALAVTLAGDKVPSRLLVSSFDHELLAAFHEACPSVALGWLIERASEEWREGAAALGAAAIHPGVEGLTESDVRSMRDAGFEVNVWTVNDVEQARELASWGVTGIFTDRPQDFPAEALAR